MTIKSILLSGAVALAFLVPASAQTAKDYARYSQWPAPRALGQPLPTLPLWIASDLSVPLALEASYQETCKDLRIRQPA